MSLIKKTITKTVAIIDIRKFIRKFAISDSSGAYRLGNMGTSKKNTNKKRVSENKVNIIPLCIALKSKSAKAATVSGKKLK